MLFSSARLPRLFHVGRQVCFECFGKRQILGIASSCRNNGGNVQSVPAIYFVVCRNWCDHMLLHEDGSFEQASQHGRGFWQLAQRRKNLVLELKWNGVRSGEDDAQCYEVAATGDSLEFVSEEMTLTHVGGPLLSTNDNNVVHAKPRALVFSSVGSQCFPVVADFWLKESSSLQFDVALVYYKEIDSEVFSNLRSLAQRFPEVELHHRKDMKWPNFLHWIQLHGGFETVASRYDYIWVVDDDVRLETQEINKMFRILRAHENIKFACPSFDAASDGVWRYFDGHDSRYQIRYTDFVECTAPIIRTSMLLDSMFQRCLRAVRTGCFIDFCFFPAAACKQDALAIIDAVQCHHPPRGPETPSEMRQVKAWEDHKDDEIYFQKAGVPRDWFWFRKPTVFNGVLVDI